VWVELVSAKVVFLLIVVGVVALGLFLLVQPRSVGSRVADCVWGLPEGNTVVSYVVTGSSTITTGGFYPFLAESTITLGAYPPGAVGSVTIVTTTVTTTVYPTVYTATQTCTYVSN